MAKHLGITSFVRDLRVFNDEKHTQKIQKYFAGASRYKMTDICIYLQLSIHGVELLQGKLAPTATPTGTAYGSAPTRPNQTDQRVR
jgi:hypothetical protein